MKIVTALSLASVLAVPVWGGQSNAQQIAALRKTMSQNAYRAGVWNDVWQAKYVKQLPDAEVEAMKDRYRKAAQELVRLLPKDFGVRMQYGNMLLYENRFAEAQKQYEQAVELKSPRPYDLAMAYYGLANSLFGQGRRKECVAKMEECLALKLQVGPFRGWEDPLGRMRAAIRYLKGNDLDTMLLPFHTGAKAFPEPQSATYLESFTPVSRVVFDLDGIDEKDARVRLLKAKFQRYGITSARSLGDYTVKLRLVKSLKVREDFAKARNLNEAYFLVSASRGALIEAETPQGILWGVVSLIQMTDPKKRAVRQGKIADWPDVAKRGYLGEWWNGAAEFTVFQKMNTVDFQKHPTFEDRFSPLNEFLETQTARQFRELGLELFYGNCWFSHAPQLPICKSRTLPYRIEMMKRYAKMGAGVYYPLDDVRFPVLSEDLEAYGKAADIDAKHLTEIFRAVRKEYPDFRLVFCPPFYWGPDGGCSYPESRDGYLQSIKRDLDPAIDIYWTGPRVKSMRITKRANDWYTGLTGRKAYLFQNGILWHNLLEYAIDHTNWPEIYYDGYLKEDMAAYHLNAHTPGECTHISTLADALWHIEGYDSGRSARRACEQMMGPGVYEALQSGYDGVCYFDRWKYGDADERLYQEDLKELEAKCEKAEAAWAKALELVKANGSRMYGSYGRGVGWARQLVTKARAHALTSAAESLAKKPLKQYDFECDPFPPEGDYTLELSVLALRKAKLKVKLNGRQVHEGEVEPTGEGKTATVKVTLPVLALKRKNRLTFEGDLAVCEAKEAK